MSAHVEEVDGRSKMVSTIDDTAARELAFDAVRMLVSDTELSGGPEQVLSALERAANVHGMGADGTAVAIVINTRYGPVTVQVDL